MALTLVCALAAYAGNSTKDAQKEIDAAVVAGDLLEQGVKIF